MCIPAGVRGQGSGFRVQGAGVWGVKFRIGFLGFEFGVWGLGCGV